MRKKKQSKRTVLKLKVNVIGDTPNQTAELKRLLRLAMEDMSEAGFCCEQCIHRHTGYDKCGDDNCFEWKHADEVEKLLGETNEED